MELSEQGERAPPGLASLLDACPVGCILAPLCGCVAQSSIHIETPFKVANYMYQVAPPFRRILAKGGNYESMRFVFPSCLAQHATKDVATAEEEAQTRWMWAGSRL